ncbi:pentapeptide repeat-containing protein [Candidatus Babeliales bacterium]|nr:pentapeptide repeat-containing protein [Candidatus Babeliales bacterium]
MKKFIISVVLFFSYMIFSISAFNTDCLTRLQELNTDLKDLTEEEIFDQIRNGDDNDKINIKKFNFSKVDLSNAKLRQYVLIAINLDYADLQKANLKKSILKYSNLQNANLSRANLSNADLTRAELCGANLADANLEGAYLYKTDMYGVTGLTQEQIEYANAQEAINVPKLRN